MLKRLAPIVAALALLCAVVLPLAVRSDVPAVAASFNATVTGGTAALTLNSSLKLCQVTIASPTVGLTITPQISTDGVTWIAASTINGGSITAPGTYLGAVDGTTYTNFRLFVGAIGSGNIVGNYVCAQSQPAPAFSPFPQATGNFGNLSCSGAASCSPNTGPTPAIFVATPVPIVNASGTPLPAGYHCVVGSVAASTGSTSVVISPAFVSGGVLQPIIDATDGTVVAESAISGITVSGFTFTSTNGKTYAYTACGI